MVAPALKPTGDAAGGSADGSAPTRKAAIPGSAAVSMAVGTNIPPVMARLITAASPSELTELKFTGWGPAPPWQPLQAAA